MEEYIRVDVTDAKECAVPKDKFRINHYAFGKPFDDVVHCEKPFLHFQILRPKDAEQRERAIEYFKEHKKLYIAFPNRTDMLLYIGCTNSVYIRSGIADASDVDFESLLSQVAHWYRFYGPREE